MALTFVGSTTGAGTGASYTVSLNGTLTGGSNTSPSPGDIVIVFVGESNGGAVTPSLSGNNSGAYSTVTGRVTRADTWDVNLGTFYKVQGSTVDTSLTVTRGANNTTFGNAAVVMVWRGVDATTPLDVTAASTSAANSCVFNPPALNAATVGAIILAGGAGTMAATSNNFTGLTGMANFVTRKGDGSTSDCGVAMASYAWAGVSYDPPAVSGGTTSTSSAWAAVTLALRPYVPPAQSLTPTAVFENGQTFHAPTVTAGAVTLTPTLYSNAQTFHAPEVTQTGGVQLLEPARLDNAQAFYAPAVTAGAVTLAPGLLTNAQAFHAPTVQAGVANVEPPRLDNTQTFYAPTASASYTLHADRFDNASVLYAPQLAKAVITLHPPRIETTEAFFAQTVTPGAITLQPGLVENEPAFFEVVLTKTGDPQTLLPPYYENEAAFFAATLGSGATQLIAQDWVESGWVNAGWVSWPHFNANQFFAPAVATELAQFVLSEAAIAAIAEAVWAMPLPLGEPPVVDAYGTRGLSLAELDAISHAVWSKTL